MDKLKPPNSLKGSIISGIATEEYRRAKIYFLSSSLTFLTSLSGVVWSVRYLRASLSGSGFYQYLSLLFSEAAILSYMKELSYSLIETLPILGIIVFLAASVSLIWSASRIVASSRRLALKPN